MPTKQDKMCTTVQTGAQAPDSKPPKQKAHPPLFGSTTRKRPPKPTRGKGKNANLKKYDMTFFGRQVHSDSTGKYLHPPIARTLSANDTTGTQSETSIFALQPNDPTWKRTLPHPAQLARGPFGRPDRNHAWATGRCFDITSFLFLKYGALYLVDEDLVTVLQAHPLLAHMHTMISALNDYDFTWVRQINTNWATQTSLSPLKIKAMTAALFHYNLSVANLMRWLGNNYTGAHRDIQYIVQRISPHVDPDLVQRLVRVLQSGAPTHFNAETSRENVLKYWRHGNNPSVSTHREIALATMNKEERNNFVIPLPSWLFRYIPDLMYTPQHILIKNGKARQICNSALRHDEDSISINMLTSSAADTELPCQFGDVLSRLLTRIWNLRITYPDRDICITANDIKSCFRQLKHHPDIMGAFSYIIDGILYLQCGQTFGSDFSPSNWEAPRRVIEQLAEGLYPDTSLRNKHRKYLNKLAWSPTLGKAKLPLTPALADSTHKGVRRDTGEDDDTPQDAFVDDIVIADIFDVPRVEQAVACSIEAIFIILGRSCLRERQDPVSWDKLFDMVINHCNIILGCTINTRNMTIRIPEEYVQATLHIMRTHWHMARKLVTIRDIEELIGRLGHIASTSQWLKFLLSELFTSLNAMLRLSKQQLALCSQFRDALKKAKQPATTDKERRHASFAQSEVARRIHHNRKKFLLNKTARWEVNLIQSALASDWIDMRSPIAHFVTNRDPSAEAYSDSSLHAAGGYSERLGFWWYIEWPEEVRRRTIRFITTIQTASGRLVSINVLEYAAMIITYVASYYVMILLKPSTSDPYPLLALWADNTTAEAWILKGSKSSFIGRALSRLQCALMINNPVGIWAGHVSTHDNIIADRISRILTESHLLSDIPKLFQEYQGLWHLRRFQPSAELISHVMDTLLTDNFIDPLHLSRRLLANPGKIIS